jgi:murein DD-endopeptidase MepM/ murein hydrolase activator NlpD
MRFDQPVGTDEDRNAPKAWAGGWFDATGFGTHYTATGKPAYHTGADLNLPNYKDAKKPVFASAQGEVVFVGKANGWQGVLIVVKHDIGVWTRYAHTGEPVVQKGQIVQRGSMLGFIGDYTPLGPLNDHLHFDVARIDLGAKPHDWPGTDVERMKRDYLNPKEWINTHRGNASQWEAGPAGAPIRTQMNTDDGTLIGTIPAGAVFHAEPVREGQWLKVEVNAGNLSVGGRVATWEPLPFAGYVLRMAVNHAG